MVMTTANRDQETRKKTSKNKQEQARTSKQTSRQAGKQTSRQAETNVPHSLGIKQLFQCKPLVRSDLFPNRPGNVTERKWHELQRILQDAGCSEDFECKSTPSTSRDVQNFEKNWNVLQVVDTKELDLGEPKVTDIKIKN
jgi:hypothetical protein